MATLTLRATKGSPLTNTEVDNNFSNINTEVGTKLNSSSYTAADVLAKLLTVDGLGSGLDADLLDGLAVATANTVSTIVARDASGNFSAGTVTAALTGTATRATNIVGGLGGSLPYQSAVDTTTLLGIGAAGTYLKSSGTAPAWATAATVKTDLALNNVENTALSTWAGSANITTLGTVATGTWNATTIGVNKGGTGRTTLTANNLIAGNGTTAVSFIAPGASGNVLTSNGTAWASATPAAAGISTGKSIAMAMIFGF